MFCFYFTPITTFFQQKSVKNPVTYATIKRHVIDCEGMPVFATWNELETACLACRKCGLCEGRHQVVFGTGCRDAKVLFIGEGPGENEDLQGEPFVGRGGMLLDKILAAVDLDRKKNIYIANMVKCRPPKNRDPLPEEQEACIDWLRNQVKLLNPQIICLSRKSRRHEAH